MAPLMPDAADQRFLRRVFLTILLLALVYLVYRAGDLLLLAFGAALGGILLSTVADWLHARAKLPRGIGLAIAEAFAEEGAWVHVCDMDRQALEALAARRPDIGSSFCDVSDRDSVAGLFRDISDRLGGLDCLVNNAGIAGPTARVDQIDPDDWERTLAVNITGQFNCARLAVPHLARSGNASIVNLSSAAGRLGFGLRTPYAASKWAVIGFTKSMARELARHRVLLNAICPGPTNTPMMAGILSESEHAVKWKDAMVRGIPLKRMGEPEDYGGIVALLASDDGRFITGQTISVSGGMSMI